MQSIKTTKDQCEAIGYKFSSFYHLRSHRPLNRTYYCCIPVLLVTFQNLMKKNLLLKTPTSLSQKAWRNQAGTDLDASPSLASLHSAGRARHSTKWEKWLSRLHWCELWDLYQPGKTLCSSGGNVRKVTIFWLNLVSSPQDALNVVKDLYSV